MMKVLALPPRSGRVLVEVAKISLAISNVLLSVYPLCIKQSVRMYDMVL